VIKQGAGNWENGHKTWLEGPAAYDYPDVIDGWEFKRPVLNPFGGPHFGKKTLGFDAAFGAQFH
jgi:hypothetical protein